MTRLLDISRLLRRAGRPMTGIDRVEWAYLDHLCRDDVPCWAIARTRIGYLLLDQAGALDMARGFAQDDFGPLDALGRLALHRPEAQRRAEADARRRAVARCLPQRLEAMLRRHLPRGIRYLNVGHSNFTDRMISALRAIEAHRAVLVHDTIPLEAPQWQRPGMTDKFRRFMTRVGAHCDLVIYNSQDTRARSEAALGTAPRHVVAHLGVSVAAPLPLPAGLVPQSPYFLSVGTIEPRKNHALLLDIWEQWGPGAPQLILAGSRGWANKAVFERLDRAPPQIIEAPGLSDGQITTLLTGARALLFPSHLEGYGLPPMEAAALNIPVLCQPLPALREVLGDIPIYEAASEAYPWRNKIETLAEQRHIPPNFVAPSWEDHFNIVLMLT